MASILILTANLLGYITGYTPIGEIDDCPNIDDGCVENNSHPKFRERSSTNDKIRKHRNTSKAITNNIKKNKTYDQEIHRNATPRTRQCSKKTTNTTSMNSTNKIDHVNKINEVPYIEKESNLWDCNQDSYLDQDTYFKNNNAFRPNAINKMTPQKRTYTRTPKKLPEQSIINNRKKAISPKPFNSSKKRTITPIKRSYSPKNNSNTMMRKITRSKRNVLDNKCINTSIKRKQTRKRTASPNIQKCTPVKQRCMVRNISPNRRTPTSSIKRPTIARKWAVSLDIKNIIPTKRPIRHGKKETSTKTRSRSPINRSNTPRKRTFSPKKQISTPLKQSSTSKKRKTSPICRSRSPINRQVRTRNKGALKKLQFELPKKPQPNVRLAATDNLKKTIITRNSITRRCSNKYPHACGNVTLFKTKDNKELKILDKKDKAGKTKIHINISSEPEKIIGLPDKSEKLNIIPGKFTNSRSKPKNAVVLNNISTEKTKSENVQMKDHIDRTIPISSGIGNLSRTFSYIEDVIPNPMILYNRIMSYMEVGKDERTTILEDDKKRRIVDEIKDSERPMSSSRVINNCSVREDSQEIPGIIIQPFDVYAGSPADFAEKKANKSRAKKTDVEKNDPLKVEVNHEEEFIVNMKSSPNEQSDDVGSIRLTKSYSL